MIIKKKNIKTGKEEHTSNKNGYKAVQKDGKWVEERMSQEEIRNRDHGETTEEKLGAKSSADKQRGVSKSAIVARKQLIDKENKNTPDKLINNVHSEKQNHALKPQSTIQITSHSISTDKNQLKEGETLKNPLTNKDVSPDDLPNVDDIKKLKLRNSFYIKDSKKQEEKMKKSIDDKMLAMLGPVCKDEKKPIVKESSVLDRLTKVEKIASTIKMPRSINTGDVLDRINNRIGKKLVDEADEEADKPEEKKDDAASELDAALDAPDEIGDAPAEDEAETEDVGGDTSGAAGTEDAPADDTGDEGEGSGLDLESGVKDETPAKPNQLSAIVQGSNYDLKANNVYDFYDLIIDKLADDTAKKALNIEYQKIPENQRKVRPAEQLYNTVVKRLDTTNKAEADREAEAIGGGEGEDLGGGGGEDELKL